MIDIFNTNKKYDIIYADPPWQYKDKKCNGNCENHYHTMTVDEICNLPIKNITSENAVLFIWVTYPMLEECFKVIKAWGFTYKTIGFQWVKLNKKGIGYFFGLGRWTRGNTECCLLAVKGKPKRISNKVSQLVVEPIKRHSEKPEIVHDKIIELIGESEKIELFARKNYKNWDVWGDEL